MIVIKIKKNNIGSFIISIFKFIFKAILAIIGIILLFCVVVVIIALFFSGGIAIFGSSLTAFSLPYFLSKILENEWELWLLYPSLIFLFITPLISSILIITRIISSRFTIKKSVTYALISLFIIGILGVSTVIITTLRSFQRGATMVEKLEVLKPVEVLNIENRYDYNDDFISNPDFISDVYIEGSKDSLIHVKVVKKAKGYDLANAEENANFNSQIQFKGNVISFKEKLPFDHWDKWRDQKEYIYIQVPERQKIIFKDLNTYHFHSFMKISTPQERYFNISKNETYIFEDDKLWQENNEGEKHSIEDNTTLQNSTNSETMIDISAEDESKMNSSKKGLEIENHDSKVTISSKEINTNNDNNSVIIKFK